MQKIANRKEFIQLYRSLLKSHRKLPPAIRSLGTLYIQSEFRAHNHLFPSENPLAFKFLREWQSFQTTLSKQSEGVLGESLKEKLELFNDEQIGQLSVLKTEARTLGTK